ncbi:uncharacterized protein LOC122360164 isoform X2 [Puntigrus tetrazona]|uniref:uncharacterized protein LOC122360164 isoform X2 n=1 Tax=Puntigrus tetrazona TaxID=1606681 RepID=UPI001C8ACA55|nr:uncharacterized protein LOC122360164 isoform X2 [Puntigrus tetrazona]
MNFFFLCCIQPFSARDSAVRVHDFVTQDLSLVCFLAASFSINCQARYFTQCTSGAEMTYVFSSSGENVRLPCNNALSDCTSTIWTYSRQSNTVELIAGGKKKKDVERHERLSLGSDCSLNIQKITEKDSGLYTCQQYVNRPPSDAPVYLYVLYVSSSSSQSEISPGSSVTLFCQLFYDGVSCDALVRAEGVQLIWVNEAGVNLQTDPRYKISFSSTYCYSSLTTRLLSEDLNREWRCQVTQRNQVKTSVSYTVKYSTPFETKTVAPVTSSLTTTVTFTPPAPFETKTVTLETVSNSMTTTPVTFTQPDGRTIPVIPTHITFCHLTPIKVIVIIVEVAVFAAPTVILLQIICARRAGRKNSHHSEEIKLSSI